MKQNKKAYILKPKFTPNCINNLVAMDYLKETTNFSKKVLVVMVICLAISHLYVLNEMKFELKGFFCPAHEDVH